VNVGFLTRAFRPCSVAEIIAVADDAGVSALELGTGPGEPIDLDNKADENRRVVDDLRGRGLDIVSLAVYERVTDPQGGDEAARDHLIAAIELAAACGIPTVSTLAGMPINDDRERTITTLLPEALGPSIDRSGELGVRIAFENWFMTNLRGLEHWQLFFDVLPAAHLGLVFDPSHLEWQQIDWREALRRYAQRVVFFHAKDVAIEESRRAFVGVLGAGWWRYVLPGLGVLDWHEIVALLREVGYDGPLVIEHEDSEHQPHEGIMRAGQYLDSVLRDGMGIE
jgi:sugar phosphate isomerase/epimerase